MLRFITLLALLLTCVYVQAQNYVPDYLYGTGVEHPTEFAQNTPQHEEHEYVDLELPSRTLWATCNVGAKAPEDYGELFAWGETAPHTHGIYSDNFYKFFKTSYITKYRFERTEFVDGKYVVVPSDDKRELEAVDDAATINWGSYWRMPTFIELEELFNPRYTKVKWTKVNGVHGMKITSNRNGKSIFLPAAGISSVSYHYKLEETQGVIGAYWSRTLYGADQLNNEAYNLQFNKKELMSESGNVSQRRSTGQSIRPVYVWR